MVLPVRATKSNEDNKDYNGPVGRGLMTKMLMVCARMIEAVLVDDALENGQRSLSTTNVDNDND